MSQWDNLFSLNQYAMKFVGVPYIWGGAHPSLGFDCSGLVLEILKAAGLMPSGTDMTSQGIYNCFKKDEVADFQPGAILFFGKSKTQITHVAYCLDGWRMIEAGGGDSTCTTVEAAIKKGAFVRVRRVDARRDLVAKVMPKY